MYCPKQGLRFFQAIRYDLDEEVCDDFTANPRPHNNLSFIIDGQVDFEENGNLVTVCAGDYAFMPKGCAFRYRWHGKNGIKSIAARFDFDWLYDPLKNKKMSIQAIKGKADSEAKMKYLLEHQNDADTGSFAFISAFYSLCAETLTQLKYSEIAKSNTVQPALDYLEVNFDKKTPIKYLASLCYLSEARFFANFKAETGMTPTDYKNKIRIRHAMNALISEPERNIEDISASYGFESAIYFRRLFKSITGKTPGEYRKSEISL